MSNHKRKVVQFDAAQHVGKIEKVPLAKMAISGRVQRKLNKARVDELVGDMDLDKIGTPVLNLRENYYFIIDGQHRIEAVKAWLGKGWETQVLECKVYTGLSEAQEADMFDKLNNVLTVSAFDKFKTRVTAGREVESAVDRIVRAESLCISRESVPGAISCVGTLTKVYSRAGEETLRKTLGIIRDSFGDAGFGSMVIDGLAHLCQRYGDQLEYDRAVQTLSEMHGGVNGLLGKAVVLQKQTGSPKAHCVAAAVVEAINSRRSGKRRMPTWWKLGEEEDGARTSVAH